jgi:hypothetical protein
LEVEEPQEKSETNLEDNNKNIQTTNTSNSDGTSQNSQETKSVEISSGTNSETKKIIL